MDDRRGPVIFTALYVAALLLTFGALLLHERFGATEFKSWAPFLQAILSAGAIFTAWWLQNAKREADRREAIADTLRQLEVATEAFELQAAHLADLQQRSLLFPRDGAVFSHGLRETERLVRSTNVGHLPSPRAITAFVGMISSMGQIVGVLEALGSGKIQTAEMSDGTLITLYRQLFKHRSALLAACELQPRHPRRDPDKLRETSVLHPTEAKSRSVKKQKA